MKGRRCTSRLCCQSNSARMDLFIWKQIFLMCLTQTWIYKMLFAFSSQIDSYLLKHLFKRYCLMDFETLQNVTAKHSFSSQNFKHMEFIYVTRH